MTPPSMRILVLLAALAVSIQGRAAEPLTDSLKGLTGGLFDNLGKTLQGSPLGPTLAGALSNNGAQNGAGALDLNALLSSLQGQQKQANVGDNNAGIQQQLAQLMQMMQQQQMMRQQQWGPPPPPPHHHMIGPPPPPPPHHHHGPHGPHHGPHGPPPPPPPMMGGGGWGGFGGFGGFGGGQQMNQGQMMPSQFMQQQPFGQLFNNQSQQSQQPQQQQQQQQQLQALFEQMRQQQQLQTQPNNNTSDSNSSSNTPASK